MEDIDRFAALMEREYASLLRVATVIVADEGMAREIVQEAFTRALLRWRRVSRYERPGAWLRLVTVRLATRAASKRRRDGVGLAIPDAAAFDRPADADLAAAIATLPLAERTVVVLHYLCDEPIEQVAKTVRARPGTVRVRLHRARARLATAMTEEKNDVPAA
jgi:RNA polymerase sigma-70 factor (ECF subfamily)